MVSGGKTDGSCYVCFQTYQSIESSNLDKADILKFEHFDGRWGAMGCKSGDEGWGGNGRVKVNALEIDDVAEAFAD